MKIPIGVNHRDFYKQAIQKGIIISSKYTGVVFNKNGNSFSWMVRVMHKNKLFAFKRFPFTEQGEKDAAEYYRVHKNLLNK